MMQRTAIKEHNVKLTCPECGAQTPADNINLDRMVAKCQECDAVFGFGDQFGSAINAQDVDRLPVPRPANLQIEQTGAELRLSRRWFSPAIIFLALFAVFWNGFMAVWFGIAIISRIWPLALFGILHAAVGLFVAYYALAGFMNVTVIRVGMGELDVKHGPLPWFGNRRLETAAIAQLYCKEVTRYRRRGGPSSTHEVHVATRDGRQVKLLSGLESSDQALYLEQEIERSLGIKDQPVRGEIPR